MRLVFDRGTILLRDPPSGVELSDLPGVLWDPRVQALRAPARRQAGCRGVVVLPTGSGKTRLAIVAMARARRPALALVPTRILLAEWIREMGSAFGGPIGCLGDGERRVGNVKVATFESGWRQIPREAPGAGWLEFAKAAARSEEGRRALVAFRESRALLAFPAAKRAAVRALLARRAGARVLVFTSDNSTAYAVAREHLLMPITCDISRAERAVALERFRRGELRALVSARVLNEGTDVPDADVAIIVGGTQGEREHVQRIGRLLRPQDGKNALVYELVMRNTSEVAQARRRRAGLAPRKPASGARSSTDARSARSSRCSRGRNPSMQACSPTSRSIRGSPPIGDG